MPIAKSASSSLSSAPAATAPSLGQRRSSGSGAPAAAAPSLGWRRGSGGVGLGQDRLTQDTRDRCNSATDDFFDWADKNRVTTDSAEDKDLAIGECIEHLHRSKGGVGKQIAGTKFRFPSFSRAGIDSLPFAVAALAAWEEQKQHLSRRPPPWEHACAIAYDLLLRGFHRLTFVVTLAFDLYLSMPSGALEIRACDIIPPTDSRAPWVVLVAPAVR